MRKRQLLLIIVTVLFNCQHMHGEIYNRFLEEGKEWLCHTSNYDGVEYDTRYYLLGDTMLLGHTYTCMYAYNYKNNGRTEYLAALREQGDSVICIIRNTAKEYLLYDFGLDHVSSVRDGVNVGYSQQDYCEMSLCDTITVGGKDFRRIYLNLYFYGGENSTFWVSGVGANTSPLESGLIRMESYSERLVSCRVYGEEIFSGEDFTPPSNTQMMEDYNAWGYYYRLKNLGAGLRQERLYYAIGDTILNEKTYKKIYFNVDEWLSNQMCSRKLQASCDGELYGTYYLALREEDGKIYACLEEYMNLIADNPNCSHYMPFTITDDGEILLYDFTKDVGENYAKDPEGGYIWVMEKSETTYYDGLPRRTLLLSNGMKLVEGIGAVNECIDMPFYLHSYYYTSREYNGEELMMGLFSFFKKGRCIFYDWPIDMSIKKERIHYPVSDRLYDLQGRQLRHAPAKGVYIQDGKKYIK